MTTLADWLTAAKARSDDATDGPWTVNLGAADLPWVMSPHFDDIDDVVVVADSTSTSDARFIAASRTEHPAMADALLAVLALHQPEPWELDAFEHSSSGVGCSGCACSSCGDVEASGTYPCPTVQAIATALGVTP